MHVMKRRARFSLESVAPTMVIECAVLVCLGLKRVVTEVNFPKYDLAKQDNKHHCQILLSSSLTVFLSKDSACTETPPVSSPYLQYTKPNLEL